MLSIHKNNMPKLRIDLPAHLHFVTTNIHNRIPLFLAERCCQILLSNIDFYRKKHGFKLIGYVIMPDHVHLLLGNTEHLTISKTMQLIKYHTAKDILAILAERPSWDQLGRVISRERIERAQRTAGARCLINLRTPCLEMFQVTKHPSKKAKHEIWQESFYDFSVYSEKKLVEKLDYIHNNPGRWDLADSPDQYKFSSFRNYFGGETVLTTDELE